MLTQGVIDRNAKFLLPLTNNKWPPSVDPVALILRIKELPIPLCQHSCRLK
jgi:hypothetical protein